MIALLALSVAAAVPSPVAIQSPPNRDKCDNRPVVMVVEGHIRDAKRLGAYAAAIRSSGLYQKLGGYYVINPRPVALFEGAPAPERSILLVRFPCLAHARAFWNSREYREKIMPLRLNPSAGDFIVTVHMELPRPDYMAGRVGAGHFAPDAGSMAGISQVDGDAK
jgi:uncharacterized protein (DUF1330 family)